MSNWLSMQFTRDEYGRILDAPDPKRPAVAPEGPPPYARFRYCGVRHLGPHCEVCIEVARERKRIRQARYHARTREKDRGRKR